MSQFLRKKRWIKKSLKILEWNTHLRGDTVGGKLFYAMILPPPQKKNPEGVWKHYFWLTHLLMHCCELHLTSSDVYNGKIDVGIVLLGRDDE